MEPTTIAELAQLARGKADSAAPGVVAMFGTDTGPGRTTARNTEAFDELVLRQRHMVDVSVRDLSVEVLGTKISMPIICSPTSGHKTFHPDGELATARAAGAAGTMMVPSMVTDYSIEEVMAVATGPLWCQFYILQNRAINEILVRRAEAAGYRAIVFTIDTPSLHLSPLEPSFTRLPPEQTFASFRTIELPGVPNKTNWLRRRGGPFVWKDLAWLRSLTKLPLLIKGIQSAEDARLCIEHGMDGVIVSNHGGFALPEAEASLHRLPEVVAAVNGRAEVYFDSGIRRGTDVLKALALGARAVLIGRPTAWGLAYDGQAGVERVLAILRDELDIAMGWCGITSARGVTRDYVAMRRKDWLNV